MKRYQNGAIVAGVAAMILSLLVGVIAGVRIGALMLRALLSAAVFGGGALLVGTLIDRFLPELVEGSGVDDDPGSPGRIDIVVDEQPEPDGEDEEVGDGNGTRRPTFDPDIVEEVEEGESSDAEQLMREAEAEESGPAIEVGDEPLDELPDIGSLADSFVSRGSEDSSSENSDNDDYEETPKRSQKRSSQPDMGDAGNDPAAIAKALRTMLGRDA